MSTKIVLILLAALLLAQCSLGKPTPENIGKELSEESKENETPATSDGNTNDSSSEESKELTVMTKLFITELSELVDFSLTAGKKLLKEVLGDLKAIEDKSDGIKAKIEDLSKVDAELDKIDQSKQNQLGRKLVLLVDLDNSLDSNKNETGKLSEEDAFIEKSLKTHGVEAIEKEFEEKFLVICETFYGAASNYLNSLNSEEQTKKERLSEWLKKFKEETDVEKKMELFGDIFVLKE